MGFIEAFITCHCVANRRKNAKNFSDNLIYFLIAVQILGESSAGLMGTTEYV